MRKYRVIIRSAKKHTRHVRASDMSDAMRQAVVIASTIEAPEMTALLGPPVIEVTEMGSVNERRTR